MTVHHFDLNQHQVAVRPRSRRRLPLLLLVVALGAMLASACGIRQIREAQDAFSEAAELERSLAASPDPVLAWDSPVLGYRIALDLVDGELEEHREELGEDDLLGGALMLRAMCLWRLSDLGEIPLDDPAFDAALDELRAFGPERLGTRDRTMFHALPGLRDHDRGLRQESYENAREYFVSAIEALDEAPTRAQTPSNHPVRVYLLLAQLQSCVAWAHAAHTPADSETDGDERLVEIRRRYYQIAETLRERAPRSEQIELAIRAAGRSMGFDPPSR